MIDQLYKKKSKKSIAICSLGQLNYLSALQYMDLYIGNSSSGFLRHQVLN